MLRGTLKTIIRAILPSARPPIIVASMGRSGSTLVFDAIRSAVGVERAGWLGHERARALVTGPAFEPTATRFANGMVYKTHALPAEFEALDDPVLADARFVFVFGLPSATAISTLTLADRHHAGWARTHLRHLRARGGADEVLERDVLGLQTQLEQWSRPTPREILCVKYDALWDEQTTLSDFLGLRVELPPRRTRQSAELVPDDQVELARRRYAPGDAVVAELPGAFRAGTVDVTSRPWVATA